jgi:hypothetical protein
MCTELPEHAQTVTAIRETFNRINLFATLHGKTPINLEELPKRTGYSNSITDEWNRPLHFESLHGIMTLTSYGKDGVPGGVGDNADTVEEQIIFRNHGLLKVDETRFRDRYPEGFTESSIAETFARIDSYAQTYKKLPKTLDDLPELSRSTPTTPYHFEPIAPHHAKDGWGHALSYTVNDGKITLSSYGESGKPESCVNGAIFSESRMAFNTDGSLWAGNDADWVAKSAAQIVALKDKTYRAIQETGLRLEKYVQTNNVIPSTLDVLLKIDGLTNQLVDAWAIPLTLKIKQKSIYITSLGQDKAPGGCGDNQDISLWYSIDIADEKHFFLKPGTIELIFPDWIEKKDQHCCPSQ